ncbi:hypothetical protein BJ742DRAFT_823692, partial [Cladochytrium replicatum]
AASRVNAGCFSLDSPSVCTDWAGYTIRSTEQYGNTAQFDKWLTDRLTNSTAIVSQWKTLYGCPNFDGTGIRYFTSFLCALTVDQAAFPGDWYGVNASQYVTCRNKDALITPLCSDTCNQSKQSFVTMLNNTKMCSAWADSTPQQQANRQTTVGLFTTMCKKLPTTNRNAGTCFDGDIPLEFATCGFTTTAQGTNYCSTTGNSANDPCCSRGSGGPNVGAIVGGVVGALVIVGLLVGFFLFWKRRSGRSDENVRYNANASNSFGFLKKRETANDDRATKGYTMYGSTFTLNHNAGKDDNMYGNNNQYGNQYDSSADQFYPPQQPGGFNKDDSYYPNNNNNMNNSIQPPAPAYSSLNKGGSDPYAQNMSAMAPVPLNDMGGNDEFNQGKKNRQSYLPQLDGKFVRVVAVYLPNMADELMLNVEDLLKVDDSFDDGWAYGKNFATGQEGFFPMACCISEVPADMPKSINKRVSSFYGRK